MSKAADRFGDALLSIIETALENGATHDEIIEMLESYAENVAIWRDSPENPND